MRKQSTTNLLGAGVSRLLITLTQAVIGLASVPAFAGDQSDPALTSPLVFNKDYYCAKHRDLREANLCDSDPSKAARHWIKFGIHEGRQAHPLFRSQTYFNNYHDVSKIDGTLAAAVRHYVKYGAAEGRSGNPNRQKKWSSDDSWGNGQAPRNSANADVTVTAGQNLLIDKDIEVRDLSIMGQVTCAKQDLKITAKSIIVRGGIFNCGGSARPFEGKLEITLQGGKETETQFEHHHEMGTNVLGVMEGGLLLLHGQTRSHSWLMLNKTAKAGDTEITVEGKTDWRKGDTILITPTRPFKSPDKDQRDTPWREAEVRVIESISADGLVLGFNEPLKYGHFGETQTFKNKVPGDKRYQWIADTRAEVALLSRNIKIQGDPALSTQRERRLGAHVMSMKDAYSYVSGVEFTRVGQEGMMARYPFHWHEAEDVSGQYFKNNTIHQSFNRCVTVHATNNARVENNVCFDHIGHGYFLEDGNETGNEFINNLAALGKRPRELDGKSLRVLETDGRQGQSSKGPASFWISNGNNTFIGNVGAGTEGTAFWYHTDSEVTGTSAADKRHENINPKTSPFGKFEGNRAHSSRMALSTCLNASGGEGYKPPSDKPAVFENFTVFSSGSGAVWPCESGNQTFQNLQVLDTGGNNGISGALTAAGEVLVRFSLFVANSKLQDPNSPQARVGLGLYDFGVDFHRTHFENYSGSSVVAQATSPSIRRTDNLWDQVTLANSNNILVVPGGQTPDAAERWGATLQVTNHFYRDGKKIEGPGAFVDDIPIMTTERNCETFGSAAFCKGNRYALLMFVDLKGTSNENSEKPVYPSIEHSRSDMPNHFLGSTAKVRIHNSVIKISNKSTKLYYTYRFPAGFDSNAFSGGIARFVVAHAFPGDIATLKIMNVTKTVKTVAQFGGKTYKKKNSKNEVLNSDPNELKSSVGAYYYDPAERSLLLMVRVPEKDKGQTQTEWSARLTTSIAFE